MVCFDNEFLELAYCYIGKSLNNFTSEILS